MTSRAGSHRQHAPTHPITPRSPHFSDRFYTERRSPHGPVPFLNSTRTYFPLPLPLRILRPGAAPPAPAPIYRVWNSRNNRKGRHAAAVGREHVEDKSVDVPAATDSWREVGRGLWRMVVRYPVWDISYDVAVIFTLGTEASFPGRLPCLGFLSPLPTCTLTLPGVTRPPDKVSKL